LGRLRAKFFGSPASRQMIRPDRLSVHLLRDIGLSDGPRSNPLMRDYNLFRR
jgi:hypothetical protein